MEQCITYVRNLRSLTYFGYDNNIYTKLFKSNLYRN